MKKLSLILLCALLGACAAPATTPGTQAPKAPSKDTTSKTMATPDPLLIANGREWRLVELMGQPVRPDPAGRVPTLGFKPDGPSVAGYNGCNQFFGSVELPEGPQRLRFGQLASTMRACPDMALEQQFMQMLAQVDGYYADAKQLHLHRARMAPLARFEAVQP